MDMVDFVGMFEVEIVAVFEAEHLILHLTKKKLREEDCFVSDSFGFKLS
jgi:hypothetical protein